MIVIAKDDSDLAVYDDIIEPYVGGYNARNVPYWVLVENQQVIGIVVVGEEPLKVIEPMGTIVSVVLVAVVWLLWLLCLLWLQMLLWLLWL